MTSSNLIHDALKLYLQYEAESSAKNRKSMNLGLSIIRINWQCVELLTMYCYRNNIVFSQNAPGGRAFMGIRVDVVSNQATYFHIIHEIKE